MFWSSVWAGFSVFSHWETWVVVAGYMVAMLGITLSGGLLMSKGRPGLGMMWMMLVAPLLQIFAGFVVIMTLAPILFSLGDFAAWSMPWKVLVALPWRVVGFVVGTLVLLLLLGLVGIGRLPGVSQFAIGAMATAGAARFLANISPNLKPSDLELWPGFLVVIGFLIVAAVVQVLVILVLTAVTSILKIDTDENPEAFTMLVMPVAAAAMFLPTFMYAAYLAPQLARY